MSVTAISWAWKQKAPRNLLLELLALADNCNDLGVCWVRVATIADKTGTTERTVQRNIGALMDKGLLRVIERRLDGSGNRCNLYLLPIPGVDVDQQKAFIGEMTTGTKAVARKPRREGDTSVTQGATPASPRSDTSVTHNHKKEPTLKGSSPEAADQSKGPGFIPEGWSVPEKVRDALKAEGFTDAKIDAEAFGFVVYWTERRDAKAKKASWGKTFINWMNRAGKEKAGPEGPANSHYKPNRGQYDSKQQRPATGAGLLGQIADRYAENERREQEAADQPTTIDALTFDGEFQRQD